LLPLKFSQIKPEYLHRHLQVNGCNE